MLTNSRRLARDLLRDDATTHVCPRISLGSSDMDFDRDVAEGFTVLRGTDDDCSHLFVQPVQFGQNWHSREGDIGKTRAQRRPTLTSIAGLISVVCTVLLWGHLRLWVRQGARVHWGIHDVLHVVVIHGLQRKGMRTGR